MMEGSKIIHFPQQKGVFDTFLSNLVKNKEENNINNLVIGYTTPSGTPGIKNDVRIYWFGEDSSYYVVGLLDDMKRKVHQWMDESAGADA